MRSMGFYANCDEAIHNIIKDYIDKTYTEYVKNFEEISPSMRSMGFYLCMDESFQNQIKAFRNKTYTDAFNYFIELMKRDLEISKTKETKNE
jgi:hypothetical protein